MLFALNFFACPQEENLWQKKREDELHRAMTHLNLLEKHKSAIEKRDLLSNHENMVRPCGSKTLCGFK